MEKTNPDPDAPATRRSCGYMEHFHHMMQAQPAIKVGLRALELKTKEFTDNYEPDNQQLLTIPVVIHVVYRTDEENISDAQIRSQLAVLNNDFRSRNADIGKVPGPFEHLVADIGIEFRLADLDPKGNPTNGIVRKKTRRRNFFTVGDGVKSRKTMGSYAWDPDRYLNIWVCRLAGQILGYATPPGTPAEADGVVIDYMYFGTEGTATAPFNLGRTTTHEVGHYLNLTHIWGEGSGRSATCSDDDFVSDTPLQKDSNYGSPSFPTYSCPGQPNGDMFMNYMDYVDDSAMCMFTQGQAARMRAALLGPRKGLLEGNQLHRRAGQTDPNKTGK